MSRCVQHLISVSGGKDSTAVYLRALELGVPFRAVFADTGNEHEAVYEYVARLHERTGGPKVEVVRANFDQQIANKRMFIARDVRTGRHNKTGKKLRWSNKSKRRALGMLYPTGNQFLDLCMWKGRFPSRMAQFCTSELKEFPITMQVVFPMLKVGPVIQWLGIRAAESANRAKQPRISRHDSGSLLWRPILSWTLDDVWAIHKKHGIKPNPLYALGFNRVGCMPCINCGKRELRTIAVVAPDNLDRIEAWEHKVAACGKRALATFFAAMTDPTDSDRPGTYSGIRTIVEWSQTTHGGRQFGMFFDNQSGGGCSSDLALCESSEL